MAFSAPAQSDNKPTGAEVLQALQRLADYLQNDENIRKSPPHLSHYRELPKAVQTAYDLLHQGAQLIHGTSTKYTLVGKVSAEDQKTLSADLLRGCELVGAASHVFLQDSAGCARPVRHMTLRASLAIVINVTRLVESFEDGTALQDNIGAQKTGAVWQSCDTILNKLLPQGNRNAIRREIFTWTQDCQETLEEFQEMVDLGPGEGKDNDAVDEEEEDDFFDDDDQQYSDVDFPVAKACLPVIKCSKGGMNVTLQACEALGTRAKETQDEKYLDSIAQLHELARAVGEGMTNFASLLYSPLSSSMMEIKAQMQKQMDSIITLLDFVISLDCMPESVLDLANKLRNAAETRKSEANTAIDDHGKEIFNTQ
jgi:hypothetical protein